MSAPGALLSVEHPLEAARAALGPMFKVSSDGDCEALVVRDELDKVVCRIVVNAAPGTGWWLWLYPLRGYERERERIAWLLVQHGFITAERWGSVDVSMGPDERGDVAVARVLLRLREIQERSLPGALLGVDIESLHDYRVAVRRTRSVLKEMRGVFAPAELKGARRSFGWLQAQTGPTRDLDVYLEEFDELRARLPKTLRADLDPLEALLRMRHARARAEFEAALTSERARALDQDWGDLLQTLVLQDESDRPDAARPIGELTAKRVKKVHRRMVSMGAAIDLASPPAQYHDLRKKGKELRYLLELFAAPLFDADAVKQLVRALKALQDVLGRHQDREVQIDMLRGLAPELVGRPGGVEALMAIGVLIDRLEADAHAARERFAASFADFSSEAQCKLVEDTFTR
jgi:CHAD domain-containing protein